MKHKRKLSKKKILFLFVALIVIWGLCCLLSNLGGCAFSHGSMSHEDSLRQKREEDSLRILRQSLVGRRTYSNFLKGNGDLKHNRIVGVRNYDESFPDSQSLQLAAALKYGVRPVMNRADAEHRKNELVYIDVNPYYSLKPLSSSVPYLVPRAAILLHDIAKTFADSLQTKGVPFNKLLVSSVLRTQDDVMKLRQYNHNATSNSCHLYGTTFDIAYNRYAPVTRAVRNDTLKWVLSEVLNDFRNQGRCYVKHEKLQGCFHITVR